MSVLSKAFSKQEDIAPRTSFLGRLLSSPLIRGFYKDEKPEIPLQIVGSTNEKKRLTSLINTIARNSATGRKILEDAAKNGYTLVFEYLSNSYGACNSDDKVLTLNPIYGDSKLIATLTHESRHAQQNSNGATSIGQCDVATEVRMQRACEADAQAAAAQTALEIRAATGNDSVWRAFANSDLPIALAVEKLSPSKTDVKEIERQQEKIMSAAFKGWFNDAELIAAYEKSYLIAPMTACLNASKEWRKKFYEQLPFSRKISSQEIVELLCRSASGKCYMESEKRILNTEQMCSIAVGTKQVAVEFFQKRLKDTGQSEDSSLNFLPVRKNAFYNAGLLYSQPDIVSPLSLAITAKRQR